MKPDSPYPRSLCPRCGHNVEQGMKRCPNCGFELSPTRMSNSCVVATILLIGYPIAFFGTCLVLAFLVDTSGSRGFETLFPFLLFVVPAVIVGWLAWLSVRNRKD